MDYEARYHTLTTMYLEAIGELNVRSAKYDALKTEHDVLSASYVALSTQYSELRTEHKQLCWDYEDLVHKT